MGGGVEDVPCLDPHQELAEAPGHVLQPPRFARGPGFIRRVEGAHVGIVVPTVGAEEGSRDEGGGVVVEPEEIQGALWSGLGGWVGG